ncbi:amidohydrolase [Microbacterium halotolerans]|uniref:amidohydrolase n=1 Tax=Microbacterium halotolerans TaxID=246613 RepID=UPI000E6AD618|nr:amidohydrolase family protein [Microbacterium halotolerans]
MTALPEARTYVAPIVTMDPATPSAQAFAVHGGRILAVGTVDHVRAAVPGATVEELDGVVLPGLIDAHMHMQRAGLKALDHISDEDSVATYIERMRDSFDDDGPEDPPFEDRIRALERVQPLLHALGFTGVIDPAVTVDEMRGYQEAHRRGMLTMRTVAMPYLEIGSGATPDVDAVISHLDGTGLSTGFGDDQLRLGPIKVYADGEALMGQALLERPWDDDGYAGLQRISDEEFTRLVRWCGEHGWGVGTHAVGGGAVALVARAYAQAGEAVRRERFQAIHAYLEPAAESIRSLADAGAIASVQPSIIWHNGRGLRAKLGARAERANPVRSWLDAGAVVAFGSDGPFFAFDPRHLMWQAVTRRVAGEEEPLDMAEAITTEEALAAYTTGASYAAGAEHDRGAIRAGMCADWALWSDDPTTAGTEALRTLTVRRTDVGGRTVFEESA